jgi:hypothetical protein
MSASLEHRHGAPARAARPGALRAGLVLALALQPLPAAAQKVRITNISDVGFGLITNLQADSRQSQNICLYSASGGGAYSISATGSGAGSSFALASGSDSLPYEVEWSAQSGRTNGTPLAPGAALTGQASAATHQFCNTGPAATASLTVILRASELSRARAGTYSGSLTLLVAAE